MIEQSGQLDRRIVIQQPVNAASNTTSTLDAFGQRVSADGGAVDDTCLVDDLTALGGVSDDLFGQNVKDYETLATVWANVTESTGSEGEDGEMMASTKKVMFIIRYRSDVTPQMRVVYGGNTYMIQTIQNADARKAFIKIITIVSDAPV